MRLQDGIRFGSMVTDTEQNAEESTAEQRLFVFYFFCYIPQPPALQNYVKTTAQQSYRANVVEQRSSESVERQNRIS